MLPPNFDWGSFWGGLIGALGAFIAAVLSVWLSYVLTKRRENRMVQMEAIVQSIVVVSDAIYQIAMIQVLFIDSPESAITETLTTVNDAIFKRFPELSVLASRAADSKLYGLIESKNKEIDHIVSSLLFVSESSQRAKPQASTVREQVMDVLKACKDELILHQQNHPLHKAFMKQIKA